MSDDSVDISSMTEEERLRYEKKQRKAAKMAAEAEAQAAAAAEAEAAEEERREQKSATKAAKAVRAAAAEEQVNTGKKRKLEREDDAAPTESKKQKTQLQKLDASIQGVQVSIENNEAELKITKNPQDKQYLQQTVLQLREEKKQLRDELKRLCDIEQQQKSNVDKRKSLFITDSIEFTREVLTDDQGNEHAMMVAPSIEGSSVVGPVFVTEDALRTMREYIDYKTTTNSLVFMGPPKSSKSMMLHEVLPRLVVASKPETEPVFVRIVLDMRSSPAQAWLRIKAELLLVCEAFEINAPVLLGDEYLSSLLPGLVSAVASGLKEESRRLWLLIDECQAPLVNACSLAEKDQVADIYKAFVRVLSDRGSCSFTGSSMITFLNSVRDLTPNGFEMFHCAEYVLLGHNAPSKQWEQNIANSLIQSLNVKSAKWLKLVGPYLTPELVLEALLSKPELFTVRPALIYQILENLKVPKSTVGFESTRLDESLLLVDDKLKSESQKDFLFALQALRDQNQFLESMRKLSDGRVPNGVEAAELFVANAAGRKLSKFAAMLCGLPNWVEAVRPTLQPPYAQYCRDYITAEGGSFVVNVTLTEAAGVKVTLIDRFKSSLTLFGDHHHMFYKEEALSISNTVVQVLFRADIGILGQRPVRSMFDHPLLQQLYQKSTKGYEHAHTQHLKQYEKWKNDGCQGQPPNSWLLGFQILKALRNVASHSSDHTELLMLMGWRPVVLDSIVSAFEKRAKETPWGFFYSADKKCFKLPENVLAQVSKSGNNNRSRGFVKQNRA